MPVRKIGMNHTSLTGKVFSEKNGVARFFESSLERDYIYILEFDHNVRSYEEQPVTIEYLDEIGKKRTYTPDFLVQFKNHTNLSASLKPTLVEVKYRTDLWRNWKELKPKFKAALDFAGHKNWKFKIMTEIEIRTEYQYNARFLSKYLKANTDLDKMNHLMDIIKEFDLTTPEELIAAAAIGPKMQGYYLYTLWHMIANGFISCDLTHKLTMNTEIWVNDGFNEN